MRSMAEREARQSAFERSVVIRICGQSLAGSAPLSTTLRVVPLSQEGEDQTFFPPRIAAQRSSRSLTLASCPSPFGL
jgi:hypothetical protein